jgi:clan AA aspartic protease (TIGR02281 family)
MSSRASRALRYQIPPSDCFGSLLRSSSSAVSYTFSNGNTIIGQFRDGINGQGTFTSSDGGKFVGEFKRGLLNGQVSSTSPRGDKFVGGFKEGHANGYGNITFVNGAQYVGEFRDDRQNGRGMYTFPNGDKYMGEFKDDRFNGQGTYVSADGTTKSGLWINGQLVRLDPLGIPIEIEGGAFIVPVTINSKITLNFTIDSGASDVAIPADVVSTLIRMGSIAKADFIGEEQFRLADGSIVPSLTFLIRSLTVGDKVVENVKATVTPDKADLLLGRSFLNRFNSWSVDNRQRLLFLN